MSTTIRLTRIGKKHQPLYRIVVKTTRDKRDGKYIEEVGFYNPNTTPSTVDLKMDRINYLISKRNILSKTVSDLLKSKNNIKK